MNACPSHSRRDGAGLTLIEVLLVLTLLVVIGALATPALEGAFARAKLSHGADRVRAAWGQARVAAMQAGETRYFRFEVGGDRFQIATASELTVTSPSDTVGAYDAYSDRSQEDDSNEEGLARDRLPSGIVFFASRLAPAEPTSSGQDVPPGAWSRPIRFYPNGTATDAIIVLADERELGVRLTLRGLTGVSAVGEAGNAAALRP